MTCGKSTSCGCKKTSCGSKFNGCCCKSKCESSCGVSRCKYQTEAAERVAIRRGAILCCPPKPCHTKCRDPVCPTTKKITPCTIVEPILKLDCCGGCRKVCTTC